MLSCKEVTKFCTGGKTVLRVQRKAVFFLLMLFLLCSFTATGQALTITNMNQTSYEISYDDLNVGELEYIDRTYTFTGVPAAYQGQTYIKTANDDRGFTGSSFLTFDIDEDCSVYVAHDDRITTKPSWMSSFTDTGDHLTSSGSGVTFSLYKKDFVAGTVTLGGNYGDGTVSMYHVVVIPSGGGGPGPGPKPNITGISFNWGTHIRRGVGADNWAITWSDNDHQYTTWGDGWGYDADISSKQSLGVSRVEGGKTGYTGTDIWYIPSTGEGGKSYGIISINSNLYMWYGPGSGVTSYDWTKMKKSTDHGYNWTNASWSFPESTDLIMPTILNFGQDYAGARDGYMYSYFIRLVGNPGSLNVHVPGKIDLARVPIDQIMNQSYYEFFAGMSGSNPTWTTSTNPANRQPVFQDSAGVGWNCSVSYNAPLQKYILMTEHTATFQAKLGIFLADEPWGPWTTLTYYDNWGSGSGISDIGNSFYWNFSNKWLSANGEDFVMVFSGINAMDSWNTVEGSFTVEYPSCGTSNPSPADGATDVSVEADLSWTGSSWAVSYDVYFGENPTPGAGEFQGNQTGTIFDPGTLVEGTTYYWAVDEVNDTETCYGDVWSFTTIMAAPGQASNPSPTDGATDVFVTTDITWTAATGATSHDVYFGMSNPPGFVGNQISTFYKPGPLDNDMTYYWRIDEVNAGGTTTGAVWSFTTKSQSPQITDISFNWGSHKRYTDGSDNWPITWADDDNQYSSWGDGGGFGGTNTDGRVSLGFARIEGNKDTYAGYNVWGGKNPENPATFNGKSYGILCVEGVLYAFVNEGSCGACSNRLCKSTDYGATWTKASWEVPSGGGDSTFLQFGKNYADARDNYVYIYSPMAPWDAPGTEAWLARVPKDQIMTQGSWEYFAGMSGDNPTWTSSWSGRQAVFNDSRIGWCLSVTYNAGLERYLLCSTHEDPTSGSGLGIFEAPEPWGPWTTVAYYTDWGGYSSGGSTFSYYFSNKWTSSNGQDSVLIWSGTGAHDAWNTLECTFSVGSTPSPASNPSPADSATGVLVDADLSWTAGSGATSHDVYFGQSSPGAFQGNQAGTIFDPGTMANNTTYYWRIDEINAGGTTTGTVWSFTTIVVAPGQASNPSPANGATNVNIDADLNWTAGSGATSHDVYFGETSPGTFQGNQAGTTFDTGTMANSTTYYWRIDEVNAGGTTTGTVWSFTTIVAAPGQASSPTPANGATNVNIDADLNWTAGSGATSHDVYFGQSSPGTFQGNQTGTTFDTGTMANDTIYYWRIDEVNAFGTTTGTVWSFTTEVAGSPPDVATNPSPADSATDVAVDADLSWTAGVGADSHDVYFGQTSPGTFQGNQTGTTFDTGTMANNTTYYWRIDEVNAFGTTTGTVWSFTTIQATGPQAITIYATGVDDNHNTIADSTVDSHWQVTQSADNSYPGPDAYTAQSNVFPIGPWIANTSTSKWIKIRSDGNTEVAPGTYVYTQTFDLTGFDSATAELSGQFSGDDDVTDIRINGVSKGQGASGFNSWHSFSITSNFTSGTNTLDFYVVNGGSSANPQGFRAEVSGTAVPDSTAPGAASNPSPADSATNIAVDADLNWTAGSGATSHDVYFGQSSPGTYQGNQAGTTFDTGTMANDTVYYWRIDEVNANGTTTGTVWSFTIEAVGSPPGTATNPSPANSATNVAVNTDLSWTAGSDATSHDVYFGESSPGTFQGNQAGTTFDPGTLTEDTAYYWCIDEINAHGTTTGTVWNFTTESSSVPVVLNSGFEYPNVSGFEYNPSGSDWNPTSNFAIADTGSAWGNTAYEGGQNGVMQQVTTIWQTVSGFQVGKYYEISWAEADRTSGGDNDLRVLIDSTIVGALHTVSNNNWVVQTSTSFEATSTTHTLKFETLNSGGGDRSCFIDAISIYEVSPPVVDYVARWKFDESSGTTASDSSGNGNHGTLNNMNDSDWVTGRWGNALDFDGTNDYVSVADDSTMDFGTGSFSISVWVIADNYNAQSMMLINGTSGGGYSGKRYSFRYDNDDVFFAVDDNSTKSEFFTASNFLNGGAWHHVVAVRDRANDKVRIYVDGSQNAEATDNTNGSIDSPGEPVYIGRDGVDNNGAYVNGQLDDIRLYDFALSPTEISDIYNGLK